MKFPSKQQTPIEIPTNLSGLSIKELKAILVQLNLNSDDCFEKADLISRIKEYQDKKVDASKPAAASKPPQRR